MFKLGTLGSTAGDWVGGSTVPGRDTAVQLRVCAA
jgi:hypothetical protein